MKYFQILCLLILVSACSKPKNQQTAGDQEVLPIDEKQLLDLISQSGKPYHVVNFYATFCKPCVRELPELIALNEDKEVAVHFVSMDEKRVITGSLNNFMKAHNLTKSYYFNGDSATGYIKKNHPEWDNQIPLSFVIHKSGRIIARKGLTDMDELKMIIEEDKSFR